MHSKNEESVCTESQFELVYQNHVQVLYNFIFYKCGNKELAEDVVQEAFIKLWENCSKVSPIKARAFLFTVARNTFLNKVGKTNRKLKFEQEAAKQNQGENPQFILEHNEFGERLEAAINQLPENQRTVFLLNRIDQMKYREIAELLNISQKAVEKRMHKALVQLRKLHKNI